MFNKGFKPSCILLIVFRTADGANLAKRRFEVFDFRDLNFPELLKKKGFHEFNFIYSSLFFGCWQSYTVAHYCKFQQKELLLLMVQKWATGAYHLWTLCTWVMKCPRKLWMKHIWRMQAVPLICLPTTNFTTQLESYRGPDSVWVVRGRLWRVVWLWLLHAVFQATLCSSTVSAEQQLA